LVQIESNHIANVEKLGVEIEESLHSQHSAITKEVNELSSTLQNKGEMIANQMTEQTDFISKFVTSQVAFIENLKSTGSETNEKQNKFLLLVKEKVFFY
jgi:hypothetical protein